jgi:hypothetical protein
VHGLIPGGLRARHVSTRVVALGQLARLYWVGLGDVKDGGEFAHAETAAFLLLAGFRVDLFLARGGHPRCYLDAMLAAAHLPTQRTPSVIGEDVFARLDLLFGDSLRNESLEDCRPVGQRLIADCAG